MFIPANHVRPARLSDLAGPALFISGDAAPSTFFVSDGGDGFALGLDGEVAGDGFATEMGINWWGMAIPSVSIEVDLSSRINADQGNVPLMAVTRRSTDLSVRCRVRGDDGFREARRVPIVAGLDAGSVDRIEAFTRWRIVREGPDGPQELYLVDAESFKQG